MATNNHKETLFNDFFHAAKGTMEALELQYGIRGVVEQVFGVGADEDKEKASLRSSRAWTTLSELYDYAFNGVFMPHTGPEEVVINGSDVIKLASSEEWFPSKEWDDIIAMGDGRVGLDNGDDFPLFKLALLAKVDMRTVRNAVSAGSLVTCKKDDLMGGETVYVDNASARRWLQGRKGFKPTVLNDESISLDAVNSPATFGSFLMNQRKRIGMDSEAGKLMVFHPSVDPKAVAQLEAGIFSLPLDAVFPIADFYQVSRKHLLDCVMRVFFSDELIMLSEALAFQGVDKK